MLNVGLLVGTIYNFLLDKYKVFILVNFNDKVKMIL